MGLSWASPLPPSFALASAHGRTHCAAICLASEGQLQGQMPGITWDSGCKKGGNQASITTANCIAKYYSWILNDYIYQILACDYIICSNHLVPSPMQIRTKVKLCAVIHVVEWMKAHLSFNHSQKLKEHRGKHSEECGTLDKKLVHWNSTKETPQSGCGSPAPTKCHCYCSAGQSSNNQQSNRLGIATFLHHCKLTQL